MLDPETFLIELSVLADEFGKQERQPERSPGRSRGPAPALTQAEIVTLALFSQWQQFPSEAAFYRWATRHLRPLFPRLPSRPQFNRQVRHAEEAITAFALHLGHDLAHDQAAEDHTDDDRAFEVLDGTGLRVRNAKRRGDGWLAGLADIGSCSRVGWYEGVRLLLSVTPHGAVTGWGIGPASTNDRVLAETFFAVRATPHPRLPGVGRPVSDCDVADMGFSGRGCEARWQQDYGAVVVAPPHPRSRQAWSKPWKRWLAGIRQVIETVNDRLLTTFGLDVERPHALDGLQARLAAAMGLHNVCCWLNRRAGRPDLAVADLIDW